MKDRIDRIEYLKLNAKKNNADYTTIAIVAVVFVIALVFTFLLGFVSGMEHLQGLP